ncbi:MAG: O-antigen ligase family protein, partial [Candidatus Muirbacterium halophilum]|nr:O-antigen ligase family protein [Candidatus Muirbacterium halophilum]
LTLSRASIFSLMIAFIFMITLFKKNYWYFFFTLIGTIAIIFYPPVWERLISIISFKDHSLLARVTLWTDALSQFRNSPLFGIGVGNFVGSAIPYDSKSFNIAFNMFITILCENGVTGLLIYIWIWISVFYSSFTFYFKSKDEDFINLTFFVIISLIAINIMSIAEDPIVAIMANWVTGFNLSLIFILRSHSDKSTDNIPYISSN